MFMETSEVEFGEVVCLSTGGSLSDPTWDSKTLPRISQQVFC